jgi:hypothetical protein
LRKIKVFGTSIQFPQDEWENIKEMPFAKKRIFVNKPRTQLNFSNKLNSKPELVEPLLDELVRDFDKLKRSYMRSKGMDVPLTPTPMPMQEVILTETVVLPTPAETQKKPTTQKQLITMSMVPRRTTRKTTPTSSKHKTPTSSKRRTPTSSKRRTPTSSKRRTPTSKRKYDMRTLRTYNTRKRTQAAQATAGL